MNETETEKQYLRCLHSYHLNGIAVPCSDEDFLANIKPEAFKPDKRHGNTLSLCEEGVVSMEQLLEIMQTAHSAIAKNVHTFCAVARLSKSDLENMGFKLNRNNEGYDGHTDATFRNYSTLSKIEKKKLIDDLAYTAARNGICYFVSEKGVFRRVR